MSTERGNGSRTRSQKYKNRAVFRNDMHDKTPKQKMINALHIAEVCQHCKGVIEWKIKYKKYKPLSQAKTCIECKERNVTKAYHVLCRNCARNGKVCAKCRRSSEEVQIEKPLPDPVELIKLNAEMKKLMKLLPERKRRTFMRYMKKGKGPALEGIQEDDENQSSEESDNEQDDAAKEKDHVPYSREELLKKFEELRLTVRQKNKDNDFGSDCDFDDSSSDECSE